MDICRQNVPPDYLVDGVQVKCHKFSENEVVLTAQAS
jgi:hypothetical protein